MRKLVFATTLLTMLALLSACGFSLRGSTKAVLPSQLQTLQLLSAAGNSDIAQETLRALRSNGITVIDENQDGVYQLRIGNVQTTERVISVNSSARAGEYELTMTLPFQLESNSPSLTNDSPVVEEDSDSPTPANTFVIEPEILVTQRNYQADPSNAVAKAEEAELIRDEMRQSLVNQILRRLQILKF